MSGAQTVPVRTEQNTQHGPKMECELFFAEYGRWGSIGGQLGGRNHSQNGKKIPRESKMAARFF